VASSRAAEEEGPFADPDARDGALRLGMFVFLASETLLFAGLFALYAGYRAEFPETFAKAVGYDEEWIGSVNTFLLLVSSFLVAWAELAMRRGRAAGAQLGFAGAWLLGAGFLALKLLEYSEHWDKGIRPGAAYAFAELRAPGASLFFNLYYLMTGLHALHLSAGLIALAWIGIAVHRRPQARDNPVKVQLAALYWHLIDIVWIFLWPLLYLIR
jgi:cytochrome c oxidase subunit 3